MLKMTEYIFLFRKYLRGIKPMTDITKSHSKFSSMSVVELTNGLEHKEFSSLDITKDLLNKINSIDGELNAFITVTEEFALKTAEKSDQLRLSDEIHSKISGIPFGIKDNICTKGIRTTCASKFLKDFIPPYDAYAAELLKNQNCPLLGKLNLDEFAMGSTTENSYFGPTKNPHNFSKVPGGSSGGPAAAVASGEVPFALGSDTGGSVRQPSAFCGIVGMKPTYGRISRNGLIAFASSFDQIGVLSKTVLDNATVLSELAVHDKNDATSLSLNKEDFTKEISLPIKGLKIGILKEYSNCEINPEIKKGFESAIKTFVNCGAEIIETSIPELKYAIQAYYIISGAEASSNLARYDGIRFGRRSEKYSDITDLYKNSRSEGFGSEVKRRIMTGTYVLSAGYKDKYYQNAVNICEMLKESFNRAFSKVDIILTPVTPTPAFDIGIKVSTVTMYLNDIFTVPANLTGLPAISVPCGKTSDGLPMGIQLIGKKFDEKTLYKAAFNLEREVSL